MITSEAYSLHREGQVEEGQLQQLNRSYAGVTCAHVRCEQNGAPTVG